MRKPWDQDPLSRPTVRALALKSLKFRLTILLAFSVSVVGAIIVVSNPLTPQILLLAVAAAQLLASFPFVSRYPRFLRFWLSIGNSHRHLGLTDLHYATLALETVLATMPIICAAWLVAIAAGTISP